MKVGLITKPQGIKGEVRVSPLTDDIKRFNNLKEVYIDGVKRKILRATISGGFVIIAISGVADRNAAELLRGKFMYVDRENAVELSPDTYFIADIEGCSVVSEDGERLGTIIEVTSAKTDVITVETTGGKIMRFPFLKDATVSVDVENKIFTVNKKRLTEIACYED